MAHTSEEEIAGEKKLCSIWSQSLANVADIPTLQGQFQEDVGSTVGADCTTTELCDLGTPLTLSVPPKLQFHQHSRVRFCAVGLHTLSIL